VDEFERWQSAVDDKAEIGFAVCAVVVIICAAIVAMAAV
jgi:hypothetical protein